VRWATGQLFVESQNDGRGADAFVEQGAPVVEHGYEQGEAVSMVLIGDVRVEVTTEAEVP
jgi:hypothetical protein